MKEIKIKEKGKHKKKFSKMKNKKDHLHLIKKVGSMNKKIARVKRKVNQKVLKNKKVRIREEKIV